MQGRVGTFLSQIRRAPLKFRSRGTATKQMQSVDMVVVQECVVHCSTYVYVVNVCRYSTYMYEAIV